MTNTPPALAKPAIDVGVFTNNLAEMLAFYREEIRLHYDELLKIGGGQHQHRFSAGHSIFKLNNTREPLPDAAAGAIKTLLVHSARAQSVSVTHDPDGNRVETRPASANALGALLTGPDPDAAKRFYCDQLGLSDAGRHACQNGSSIIEFSRDTAPARAQVTSNSMDDMRATGLRYLTLQVKSVAEAHERALAAGAIEGRAPNTLGAVASISFVRDPSGCWLELSQRASLTGDLTIS